MCNLHVNTDKEMINFLIYNIRIFVIKFI